MEWFNLQKTLEEYSTYLKSESINNMPSYYELKDKITFRLDINGTIYEISFIGPEYWKWAENGRRPGKMPPLNVIESWIERRKIVPYAINGRVPSKNQVAFLIARKIGKYGTEGVHFLDKAVKKDYQYWHNKISDAVTSDILKNLDLWLAGLKGDVKIY